MTPPDRLPAAIDLRTTADGAPAEGLLVLVSLKMGRKNDFEVVAGPSGPGGRLRVTAAELRAEIERTLRQLPADYHDPSAADGLTGVIELMPMAVTDVEAAEAAVAVFGRAVSYPVGYSDRLAAARSRLARLTAERIDIEIDDPNDGRVRFHTTSRPAGRAPLARTA